MRRWLWRTWSNGDGIGAYDGGCDGVGKVVAVLMAIVVAMSLVVMVAKVVAVAPRNYGLRGDELIDSNL